MTIETTELEALDIETREQTIILLPNHLATDSHSADYSSTAISFAKYAASRKSEVTIEYYVPPKGLIERRSGDWFSPVILITSHLAAQHPLIAGILCNLLSDFIYETFRGMEKPKLHVEVIVEKNGKAKKKFLHMKYTGSVDDLDELSKGIQDIMKND